MVQEVVPTTDCRKAFAVVMSFAQQDHPFGAVVPGAMMNVLAPVVPVHLASPAHDPPCCVVIVAQAPVPVRLGVPFAVGGVYKFTGPVKLATPLPFTARVPAVINPAELLLYSEPMSVALQVELFVKS